MAYRLPGVKVTQIFLNAQPALAAQALPNVVIGPAYQLVNDDLLGTYTGNLQAYGYASLAAGAQVDLEKELAGEVYPATKKPLSVVIKDATIEILAESSTGYTQGGSLQSFKDDTATKFANVLAGDKVVISPVTGLPIVTAQTDGVTSTANPNRLTAGSAGLFANVKPGDSVVVTGGLNTNTGTYTVTAKITDDLLLLDGNVNDGGGASSDVAYTISGDRGNNNAGEYVVKAKTSDNILELQSPLSEEESPITYTVIRDVDSIEVDRVDLISEPGFVADENGIELPAGLLFSVGVNDFEIIDGSVYASYRGLRNDLATQLREFTDIAEIYALYGNSSQVTPQNPLGFASSIALQNAVTPTRILGLDGDAVSNELLSYLNAFDVLEAEDTSSTNPSYAITVLTHNPVIHQNLKTHVDQLSSADNKLERMGLFNRTLITEEELQAVSTTSTLVVGARIIVNTQVDGEGAFVTPTVFTDLSVDAFLNVQPGDTVTIVSGTNCTPGAYDVVSKTDNNNVVLNAAFITSGTTSDIVYFINRKDGVASNGINFYDRNATFFATGIGAGDIIRITAASNSLAIGDHKITSVISDKEVQVEQIPGITVLVTAIEYEVVRELTKTKQAEAIAGYSSSIGSRRMVHVWPDVIEAPVGNTIEKVPGYYGAVAIGALVTGLPTQQGFTNLSLSGFLGLSHSSRYFKESELNTIAGGGTLVLAQQGEGQALFVRHQLTTDTSTIQFQELSVTKNVDFAAKFIRNNYKSFIGVYNIVDTTFDELKSRAKALITFLKESTRQPRIGGVIRSGTLTRVVESETQPDTVLMTFRCDFPIPLNNIDIDLEIE